MRKTELAIATDFHGESLRLEEVESLLERISQTGFTHIHWCHEWEGDYTYSVYEMEQIRQWMDKYGLQAKSLHASKGTRREVNFRDGHFRRDYTSDWELNRKAGVELVKNRIDLAARLGAEDVVLHLYVPFASIQEGEIKKENFYANVKKSLDELQDYCLEKNIRICLENLFDMPKEYMEEQWDWVMQTYPADFLGFCLDTGHANLIWGREMTEVIRKYRERIFAVHLHDNYGSVDYHMIPGKGNIPWEEVMKELADSAYQLPLILEVGNCQGAEEEFLRQTYEAGLWLDRLYRI